MGSGKISFFGNRINLWTVTTASHRVEVVAVVVITVVIIGLWIKGVDSIPNTFSLFPKMYTKMGRTRGEATAIQVWKL